MPDGKKADAVLVPANLKVGRYAGHRIASVLDVALPLLGTKRAEYRSVTGGGMLLVTEGPDESMQFPKTHPYAGQDRYNWSDPDERGVRTGTLRDLEAEEQAAREAAKPRPAAAIPRAAGHVS